MPPTRRALTTLSDASVKYQVPEKPYVVLKRADVEAVVVDNRAVKDDVLPGHRANLSGIASLTHRQRPENLFKAEAGGLNFEHIHDGTVQDRNVLFEPRMAPMELRVIDPYTAELYQKPTPHWGLESCHRYRLLEDGTIEMTFECIPRQRSFERLHRPVLGELYQRAGIAGHSLQGFRRQGATGRAVDAGSRSPTASFPRPSPATTPASFRTMRIFR